MLCISEFATIRKNILKILLLCIAKYQIKFISLRRKIFCEMKKVTNVSLGGRNFTLDDDAYNRLSGYLEHFRARLTVSESQKAEVMDEIEGRIAELFYKEIGDSGRVVTLSMVEQVASTLGMPDGTAESGTSTTGPMPEGKSTRKLYRDPDDKKLAGICSGLSYFLDADVTLIRVLMLVALIFGSAGFWIYIILWIAVPMADTPAKKCEMRGMSATAENMSRFTSYKK
jgi:phage shock protein PspC (stress-responsive transcriptional regulator)